MNKKGTSYFKNLPIPIKIIVLGALVVSIFFILKAYTGHLINQYNYPFSWVLNTLKISINYLLWVLLTPMVYSLTKLIQNKDKNGVLAVLKIMLGIISLALVHQLLSARLNDFVYYVHSGYLKLFFGHNNMVELVIGSFSSIIELLVLIAIFLAFDYQKRYLHNQKELIAAQLTALQMQLHPHFLFNTLHSISSMIDIEPKKAQKMLTKMGALMRTMLENDKEQMVSVQREITFIKNYLDLEQIRFADKMVITYHISENTSELQIPNMILQPLVENAIKYGIMPTMNNGQIIISIKKGMDKGFLGACLELKISNTSLGQNAPIQTPGAGVGLMNIRKRLESTYQNRFLFKTGFVAPKIYESRITLPIRS